MEAVVHAIKTFPNGSAGGPDGLRPQHLKDLTGSSAGDGGPTLLATLTAFVNLVLLGGTSPSIRPYFFGASLTALEKKGGGIRPIAVGCTLRRLVAKVASASVREAMADLLAPHQLGFGVKKGPEAAVHVARLYLHNLSSDKALLKIDFRNAFNSVRRDKLLLVVKDLAPEIYPLVHSSYSSPSSLFWSNNVLQSSEGVQQGDPLGPLLFCLAIFQLQSQLQSELCLLYLDDVTLGGTVEEIMNDLEVIFQEASDLGLSLNPCKPEIICINDQVSASLLSLIPGAKTIHPSAAHLLGAPLGDIFSISNFISEKTHSLKVMDSRLRHLQAQDAIILLRHSFAIPKLLYSLRTSPCFSSPALASYDDELRSILSSLTNTCLDESSSAWTQATLLVSYGGLGIRSAVQLAPSAFLASAAGSSDLIHQILPSHLRDSPIPNYDDALTSWAQGHDQPPPDAPASHQQKSWDTTRVRATADSLLDNAPDDMSRARLLAASSKEAGAWLNALPISSLGLRLDDTAVRIAVGLRLGTSLCRPHTCTHCGANVDHLGTHGLSCRISSGHFHCHAALNDIIHKALTSANVPAHLEPSGLCRSDGKRPDGVTIVPWKCGRPLVWDATCPDTFAASYLAAAASEAGRVAAQAEEKKRSKYLQLPSDLIFVPIAIETSGVIGKASLAFLAELGLRIKSATSEPRSFAYLLQRLSVAVQRGNAISILGTAAKDQSFLTELLSLYGHLSLIIIIIIIYLFIYFFIHSLIYSFINSFT